jgi:hypothetical protein
MEREDVEELRAALLAAARDQDADATEADEYGERYVLDFSLRHEGREARVRSAWIIRKGENFLRLTGAGYEHRLRAGIDPGPKIMTAASPNLN